MFTTTEERLANMERLTGMTRQEIGDYTNKTLKMHNDLQVAKNDGATDAELIAIATQR